MDQADANIFAGVCLALGLLVLVSLVVSLTFDSGVLQGHEGGVHRRNGSKSIRLYKLFAAVCPVWRGFAVKELAKACASILNSIWHSWLVLIAGTHVLCLWQEQALRARYLTPA
eukprot:5689728-Amphidinium_carterae.1